MEALHLLQNVFGLDVATALMVAPALFMALIFIFANLLHFLMFGEWIP